MTKKTNNATSKPNTSVASSAKAAGRGKPDSTILADQLSDQQLVALSAACQRDDRTIAIPETLEGDTISAFAISLIQLGLAEEAPAERGQPVWRQDEASGQPITFHITDLALAVLGIDEEDEARSAEDTERNEGGEAPAAANKLSGAGSGAEDPVKLTAKVPQAATMAPAVIAATNNAPTQPRRAEPPQSPQSRAGSKQGQLITMLSRGEGASISEIATALGWLPHTTRAALTGLRHKGYELGREINGDRGSIYRIFVMPIAAPAADGVAMVEAA